MRGGKLKLKPISYAEMRGWQDDDHAAAFRAFRRSCAKIVKKGDGGQTLFAVCKSALALNQRPVRPAARTFFEKNFTPHQITIARRDGLLTSYFEPVLKGSRRKANGYEIPVYRRPEDLVLLSSPNERGTRNEQITAMRKTATGTEPYPTREDIEKGALKGRDLELIYLKDPVNAYFMHVQGSARIKLTDGKSIRIGFAAKNGYPYTSIGKALVDQGEIDASSMSMQRLMAWMRANPEKAKQVMWKNRSYIFFRELDTELGADGPIGAQGVALSPGRSLAVDAGFHELGTPLWVSVPQLKRANKRFERLMIAQDVGSAIQGPERGDIYWGSGEKAGRTAGTIKYPGNFTVLVPNVRGYR